MIKSINIYVRRFYYAIVFIGKKDWLRRMELLNYRENIEYHVDRREATAGELIALLVSERTITPQEIDTLRFALAKTGHLKFSSGSELDEGRAELAATVDLMIELGMVSPDDAETLKGSRQE